MLAVGNHYVTYLVKACAFCLLLIRSLVDARSYSVRRAKGPTPQPSNHPSNPDTDLRADLYRATLVEAPTNHRDARKQALVRDGYKCVITHSQDTKYIKEHHDKWNGLQARELEAAHIIPEYINQNIARPNPLKKVFAHLSLSAGHIWRLLEMFGNGSLLNELNGRNAHALDNIMMLCHDVHAAYDRLDMWLEELDPPEPNKYRVHNNAPWEAPGYPFSVVEFTSPAPQLPLPNPRWIAVHAAVCRVAHLSGAAQYVEEQYRRLEDMDVMAFEGPEAIRDAEILSAQLRLVDVHG
ncbi:hypothetical protein EXIGLDRAFT_623059 [Exidia glandulosa HHB12029]|uniref:HNH nuclease domain-containing protein n=1 Tax=Exidia glandulosa HHB12029 TaxID=1314781 RepID=A0A165ZSB0_EXIGL|nr:hypothetical protein EXIGLDRAFT_623059 [Exidia glandulosa HHB12029]